jgi:hypothetical protein
MTDSRLKRCLKCQGLLTANPIIKLRSKLSILHFRCLRCGRSSPAGVKLGPYSLLKQSDSEVGATDIPATTIQIPVITFPA